MHLSTLNGEMGELQFDAPGMQEYFRIVKNFSMIVSKFIFSFNIFTLAIKRCTIRIPQKNKQFISRFKGTVQRDGSGRN